MTDARLEWLVDRVDELERQVALLLAKPRIAGVPGMWGVEWVEHTRTCGAPAVGPVCDTAQIEGGEK